MVRRRDIREVEIGGGALEAKQCSVVRSSGSFWGGVGAEPYPCFLIGCSNLRNP